MNKKRELRNNENVNNYGCLLKRMLYCAGNGQELLSALGVTLVCHASNVFRVLKVPTTSKFLTDILSPLQSHNGYSVANSLQFSKELSDIKIDDSEVLVSFDVVSPQSV